MSTLVVYYVYRSCLCSDTVTIGPNRKDRAVRSDAQSHVIKMAAFQIQQIYKLKVVIVGPISVGKTSLAVRFAKDTYEDIYNQTIGGKSRDYQTR